MMSLPTVKDSERKLSPHSDVREVDTGEGGREENAEFAVKDLPLGRTLLYIHK